MSTVLITGATRGLGRAAAHAAASRAHVLVGGRTPEHTARAAADVGGAPLQLDLGSLAAVHEAAAAMPDVDVVVCNAGLQSPNDHRTTIDGFEETFQVNHLAHLALVDELLRRERPPARIVFVGSGTHDPSQRTGMPAPREDDIEAISRGDVGDDNAGRRRYTTSKLLVTALTGALAREREDVHVSCLDPGLMTATGLSREYPAAIARVSAALGHVIGVLPFASTPGRSGARLAALALDDPPPIATGRTLDHRGRPARISARAADPAFQGEVLGCSRDLLRRDRRPAASNG